MMVKLIGILLKAKSRMTTKIEEQDEPKESWKGGTAPSEKPDYGYVAIKYFIYTGMMGGLFFLAGFTGWFLGGIFGGILWWVCLPLGVMCIWVTVAYIPLHYAMMRERALPNHWNEVLNEEKIENDACALDIGCGTGRVTISVAKVLHQARVIGIDIFHGASGNSPDQGQMNAYLEGVGNRVEIRHGNALQIPYPDNTFDLVTSSSVLHDIHNDMDKKKAVQEVHRVLKSGGIFVALELFRDTRMWLTLLFFSPVWKSEKFWRKLFNESSFKQVKAKKYSKFLNYGILLTRKE
jgi:ubiquinone/menaquinone biosynthesis C-methylase UbiE